MVLRDDVPVRMLMKDIGEEVAVLGNGPLPAAVERIRAEVPLEEQSLSIHTDVFDGFLRHLSAILDVDDVLSQASFWALVRECIEDHLADHPALAEAAARQGLLRPRSEEHTSELQSLMRISYAVFCLKKKKQLI